MVTGMALLLGLLFMQVCPTRCNVWEEKEFQPETHAHPQRNSVYMHGMVQQEI